MTKKKIVVKIGGYAVLIFIPMLISVFIPALTPCLTYASFMFILLAIQERMG